MPQHHRHPADLASAALASVPAPQTPARRSFLGAAGTALLTFAAPGLASIVAATAPEAAHAAAANAAPAPTGAGGKLKIGITLHPYYSYVANIVQDRAEVLPFIDAGFNPHAYEPRAEDIKRIGELDVAVLNDVGHDDFARRMIAASARPQLPTINANVDVPLLSTMALGTPQGRTVNPHTFISISAAMIQVTTIARELGRIAPQHAAFFADNARAYNRRLRKLRADALAQVTQAPDASFRVATVHGAYDYLLREFGLEVSAVIEPAHGMEPSAAQLKAIIDRVRSQNIRILFAEQDNPANFVKTLVAETGMRVYTLTHISHGPYTADKFERDMATNLDAVIRALRESRP